jgi:hypothetical protein
VAEPIQITITLGSRKITINGVVEGLEGLSSATLRNANNREPAATPSKVISERDLLNEKLPRGHSEIVAVLAFALRESGLSEFTEADMRRSYLRANIRPPKSVSQAIRDARNKSEFIAAGKSKGKYRLSPYGETFVMFDMPRERK